MIDDMTLHGLKPKTIRAYVTCVARFGRHFGKSPALAGISASRPLWPAFRQVARFGRHFGKSPALLGTAEIRSYLLYLTHERCVASRRHR